MPDEEAIHGQEEDLFDDDDLDWGDIDTEDEDDEPVEEQEDEGLTVKYNGKDTKVAKDKIPELVQKGMNYDHIKEELEGMRSGNEYKVLKKLADKEGMSTSQYAKFVLDKEDADTLSAAEAEVRKEHPNWSNADIKELAEARAAKKQNLAKAEADSAAEKAWADALKEYPSMTKDNIPNDVLQAVAAGKTPLIALKDYEIAQLKAEKDKQAIEEKNKKNKEKSTGSMRGRSDDGGGDAFLKEFLSSD